MRIGCSLDTSRPIPEIIAQARSLADLGFSAVNASQIFAYDTLTVLAVLGTQVPDIELVTAVVPTYPRHPFMLAAQALTVQAAVGDRLTLGIGLSHQVVIENVFGMSFEKPARHMREYLEVLMPLLRREPVDYAGETIRTTSFGPIEVDAPAPRVIVAALGPVMLKLAGRLADGTATWMTGPATLESHIIPTINEAAAGADRPPPLIHAGLPVCVSADVAGARQKAAEIFAVYGGLPSYQAMLEREGAAGPADVAIVGTEAEVADQIRHLADVGVTDFHGAPYGSKAERDATVRLLASLSQEATGVAP